MHKDQLEVTWALCAQSLPAHHGREISEVVLAEGSFERAFAPHADASSIREAHCRAERMLEVCEKLAIKVIPLSSPEYPSILKASPGAPLALFVKGRKDARPREQCIAIVGSRSASLAICSVAFDFAQAFARAGVTVVSGLALGVDGAAHRGALEGGEERCTIAVLAHGLDTLYPSSHEALAERILGNGGLLVSEYPPGTKPLKHHFLERNRIVAGLSRGVVVVQAGARSGSLVTARFAGEAGRDVFVTGVSVSDDGDERFEGSSRLAMDGARCVTSPLEILTEYGLTGVAEQEWVVIPVQELLGSGVLSQAALARLEVQGCVDHQPGGLIRMSRVTFEKILASARALVGREPQ